MKKKLLSLAIAATLLSQTFAYAGALTDFVGTHAGLGAASGLGTITSGVFTVVPDVVADVKSEVKENGTSGYANDLTIKPGVLFDYKASIDMTNVRNKFTELYTGFDTLFGAGGVYADPAKMTAFGASTVEGGFTVTIDYDDAEIIKPGTVTLVLNPDTIFTLGTETYSAGKIEVPVNVKAGTTVGAINADINGTLADLSVELTGFTVNTPGTYTMTVSMNGHTDIVETDTSKYGLINYKSNDDPAYLDDTATITCKSSSGAGGGSSAPSVKTNDDGKITPVDVVRRGSAYYVNTKDLPKTTTDGEEIEEWCTDPELENPITPGSDGYFRVSGNTTLYPKVKKTVTPPVAKTVVDGNETDVPVTQNDDGTYSVDVDAIEDPVKEGFSFEGWYSEPALINPVSGVINVTEDTKLYPRFVRTSAPSNLISGDHILYVVGYPDGEVKPNRNVTREEAVAMFYRLLDPTYRATIEATDNQFPDVESDRWSNSAISTMANGGYIVGDTDGNFNPGAAITRAEFAVIASKFANVNETAQNIFSDIEDHWGKEYILRVASQYWISGYEDGTFRPDGLLTRAEAMTIINKMLVRYGDHDSDKAKQWPDVTKDDWYYDQVIEATTEHTFVRDANGWSESWQ